MSFCHDTSAIGKKMILNCHIFCRTGQAIARAGSKAGEQPVSSVDEAAIAVCTCAYRPGRWRRWAYYACAAVGCVPGASRIIGHGTGVFLFCSFVFRMLRKHQLRLLWYRSLAAKELANPLPSRTQLLFRPRCSSLTLIVDMYRYFVTAGGWFYTRLSSHVLVDKSRIQADIICNRMPRRTSVCSTCNCSCSCITTSIPKLVSAW